MQIAIVLECDRRRGFSNHLPTFVALLQALPARWMHADECVSVSSTLKEKVVISFSAGQLAPLKLNQPKSTAQPKKKM